MREVRPEITSEYIAELRERPYDLGAAHAGILDHMELASHIAYSGIAFFLETLDESPFETPPDSINLAAAGIKRVSEFHNAEATRY